MTQPRVGPFPAELRTDRLTLRLPSDQDARVEHEMILESLEHLWPWFPFKAAPPSLDDRTAVAARQRDDAARGAAANYLLFAGDRGVGKAWIEIEGPAARMGWWLRASATGRGYATEAIGALAALAFEIGSDRVEAHIDPDNAPSHALAERAGFTLQRILPGAYVRGDGLRRPECLYVMRRDDREGPRDR